MHSSGKACNSNKNNEYQKLQAKGEATADDGEPADLEAVKNLPDKLNSETEKEVQKKIEDMFAD